VTRHWPGWLAVAAVLTAVGGSLLAVLVHAGGSGALGPADAAAIRFTLWQAALSALASVALAVPVARALARRRFGGRGLLVALLGAPFILPTVAAAFGLLAIFGQGGLVNDMLDALGFGRLSIYGPQGVILAHVFYNLPLAVRLLLQGWSAIPAERFRAAAALGFTTRDINRHLERPMLREVLPGAFLAVFLICLSSFSIALMLGGGPRATTVELAIYQAFRFDFDLGRAATLAAVQLCICGLASLLALWIAIPGAFGAGLGRQADRWDANEGWRRAADAALLAAVTVFLLAPVLAVAIAGLAALGELGRAALAAALRSLAVGACSALLAVAAALAIGTLAAGRRGLAGRLAEGAGMLPVVASPLVIGTGAFLLLRPLADTGDLALAVTALANALAALPFALRAIAPAAVRLQADYGRLADSLSLRGLSRLRHLVLPRLRPVLCFAFGLSAALSIGDLGVIALFGDPARATLPYHIQTLMGAYRMDAAAAATLLLLAVSFGVFLAFERLGRHDPDA